MNRNKLLLSCLVFGFAFSAQATSAALQFTNVSSGVSAQLNRVAYDGTNTFVAVGLQSSVTTAPFISGPMAWSSNSFPLADQRLNAVTYGDGTFLVGGQDAKIFSSESGFNDWTNRNNANGLESDVEGLAYGDDRFVAPDSFIQTFWTTNLDANWIQSDYVGKILESYRDVVAFDETSFAVCGILGTIRVSTDSAASFGNNRELALNEPDLLGIASDDDNMLVAVGEAGTILYSTNSPWTAWYAPTNMPTAANLNGVAYSEIGGFMAVGDGGVILTSPNGLEWTTNASPVAGTNLRGVVFPSDGDLAGVAALVGENGTIVLAGTEPLPPINPMNATNCSSGIDNSPLCVSPNPTPTSPLGTTTFDWYDVAVGGSIVTNGVGTQCYVPLDQLPDGFGAPSNFTYYAQARDLRTGFINTNRVEVTLTINPVPVGSDDTTNTCSSVALNYDLQSNLDTLGNGVPSTFIWGAADNPDVSGESTTTVIGGVINDTITNVTATTQSVVYTVSPISLTNDCFGVSFTVTAMVYPQPLGSNDVANSCSDVALAYDLQGNVDTLGNGVASTFEWVAAPNGNVTGESTTPQAGSVITDTIKNVTGTDQLVQYTVTPTSIANGCVGDPFTVSVTVHPEPVGVDDTTEECSGFPLFYGLQDNVNILGNGVPSTFVWVAESNPNVSGESTNAVVSDSITDALRNTNGADQLVVYTVMATSIDGCVGDPFTVSVTVHPEPVGVDELVSSCDEEILGYDLQANVDNLGNGVASTFIWEATLVEGVSGVSVGVQTNGVINDSLTNTTANPGMVAYFVTPTSVADGCTGEGLSRFYVTVTVNPTPASPVSLGDVTNCVGITPNPALEVTVGAGATAYWYGQPNGGQPLQIDSTSYVPTDVDEGIHSYYVESVITNTGCGSGNKLPRTEVALVLESCPDTLAISLDGSSVPDATNVVLEWYGNLYLQSSTNMTPPITWVTLTQGVAGQMFSYTNPIAAPLSTNIPASEFFILSTNSP